MGLGREALECFPHRPARLSCPAAGSRIARSLFSRTASSKTTLYITYHYRRLHGETRARCRFLAFSRRQLYRHCDKLGIHLRRERGKRG